MQPRPITVLASSRTVLSGHITAATIVISLVSGKITSIFHSVLPPTDFPAGTPYVDHSPHLILPGLVDAHVHLNEPGRTEWEGFWTGTRAAAFGGVTTVIDMPLNAIPPTTTVAGLKEKVAAAHGQCWVDVGFYGGIVPGNAGELKELVKAGVKGFKCFLIDSGVKEFPAVSSTDIELAMSELASEPTMLLFHAEMIPPISESLGDSVQCSLQPLVPVGPLNEYNTFLASRPSSFETYAISQVLSLASLAPKLPLHIVHLSAVEAIPLIGEAQASGVKITAETCFHYLSFAAESIQHGDTRHKCCPPIRAQLNQDGLWDELLRGENSVIRTVVSDHSPCTPNLKLLPPSIASSDSHSIQQGEGDFFAAWGGVSSVGLGLSILWTEGEKRGVTAEDVVKWCCLNTAKQVGLDHQKGDLRVGLDGDVAVFDDEATFEVGPDTMLFRNKCSPYQGKTLKGVVKETWVRGQKVFERDEGFGSRGRPVGKLLLDLRKK
ncbi:hypothetical protein MMC22_008960 [Lobaria immixta]|nr:hypothetical protein [Lobaria immixta]